MAKTTHTEEVLPAVYKALSVPAQQLGDMLRQNIGAQGLKPTDLDKIKVPAGGGQSWEIPTLKGVESSPVIEGIILHFKDVRTYWKERDGGNNPPDCSAADGMYGIGTPGGDCVKCPFAQFGSGIDEKGNPTKGQACKSMRLLLFLRQNDIIPLIVSLPPTSVQPSKKYFLRLVGNGFPYYAVTTQLRLDKTTNGKNAYSVASFAMGRELSREEVSNVQTIGQVVRELFAGMTVDARDAGRE